MADPQALQSKWDEATPATPEQKWQDATPDMPKLQPSHPVTLPDGIDHDKLSVSLVNSHMLSMPAATVYQNHDLVNQQLAKNGAEMSTTMQSLGNAIKVGAESSIFGLAYRNQMPEALQDPDIKHKFISGIAQMVSDLPFYMFGAVAGAAAGGVAGSEVPVAGNIAGAGIGAGAGAWAVPAAVRESLVLGIQRGEIKSFSDLMERTIETTWAGAKGALLGRATDIAGVVGLPGLVKNPAASTALKLAQQAAALTTVSSVMEGKIPTADEFAVNTALLVAMHYGMTGLEKAGTIAPKLANRVQTEYVKSGLHPADLAAEALRRVQTEPVEDVMDHINELTRNEVPPEEPTEAQTKTVALQQPPAQPVIENAKIAEQPTELVASQPTIEDHIWQTANEKGLVLGSSWTGEGFKKDFGLSDTASMKDLEAAGIVQQNSEGLWELAPRIAGDTPPAAENTGSTGIKNASVTEQRAQRGLPPLDSAAATTREGIYAEAKAKVDSGGIEPLVLAKQVVENPRGITDVETDALNYYNAQLSNQHKATMDTIEQARADGDTVTEERARERLADVEQRQDVVEQAARKAGTVSGRALRARQEMVAQDYSLDRVLQRARVSSKDGTVSPDVRDRLETLTTQLETANAKVAEYESTLAKRRAQDAVTRIQQRQAREGRKVARAEQRDALDEELSGLVKDFDSLLMGRMSSNPMFDPEVIGVLGKMARNRVEAGITHIEDIVDSIHAKLTDIGHDVTRREIMDAISGYGKIAEMSKDEIDIALREAKRQGRLLSALEDAQQGLKPLKSGLERDKASEEIKALQKQVNQAMRESGLMEKKTLSQEQQLARYKTYITNRIAGMEQQLATGNFATEQHKPLALDDEAMRLKTKAEETRSKIDDAIKQQKLAARGKGEKVLDTVTKWRRAGLLTGWTTLGKLTKAAMDRMGVTPIEEMLGGVLSHIPGIDEISKRAPMHGGGFNVSAEVKAVSQLWQKATGEDMWRELKTGQDSLDLLFGGKAPLPTEVLGYIGQLHGALKVPEKRAEFFRRMEIGLQSAKNSNLDVDDPRVQSAVMLKIQQRAYDESLRAIGMQKNMLTTGYSIMLGYLHGQGEEGRAVEAGLRFLFPMVRIATNIPAETVAYTPVGLAYQTVQALRLLANPDKMGRAPMDQLSAHDFDNVMRGLKKGSVGLAFMAIGFGLRKNITGYYATEAEKRRGVKRGIIKIGNVTIPAYLSDTPPMMAIQIAATVGHIWDHYNMKGMSGGLIAGAVQSGQELAMHTPFYGEMARMGRKFETPEQSMVASGELAGSMIVPRLVSQIAEATDPLERQRKARGFTDAIKLQVPGLRETVPRRHR